MNVFNDVSDTFTRKHALKTGHIAVVPSWLDKYNNCHLVLSASSTQSGEFSRIEVQDVVTKRTHIIDRSRVATVPIGQIAQVHKKG